MEVSQETVDRYRALYHFRSDAHIDPLRVASHWDLETSLARQIIESSPQTRWQVTERAYSELYEELEWHNDCWGDLEPRDWADWLLVAGSEPLDIYEVGSGQGQLLRTLARSGHRCRGTDITSERGERYDPDGLISWGLTDGVHLNRYEPESSFDMVISHQVIEHLHPEDLATHLSSASSLLRPGGRYVMSVPHRLTGPHDVSEVFGLLDAEAMHLREYTWSELRRAARDAGFGQVSAASLSRFGPAMARLGLPAERVSKPLAVGYLYAMIALESLLGLAPNRRLQRDCSRRLKSARVFADNIFLVARKG